MRSPPRPSTSVGLSFLLAGCAATPRVAEPIQWSTKISDAIATVGRRSVENDGIVGLSIGVAVHGQVVYADGFGHADATRSVPVDARTIYDVASIGKQFTAVAVLQLAEQGVLSLDQRVREFVPGLPPHFPDATLDHLLRHTSGFVAGELDEFAPPADYARPRYGQELLSDVELRTGRIAFPEGESWIYCNPGYLALGLVVEAASGQRYDRYVREHLLDRLSSHSMLVCEDAPLPAGSQRLHRTADGVAPLPHIDMTAWGGQGSICSNVLDLLQWASALRDGRLIVEDSLRAMRSPSTVRGEHSTARVPYGMAQRLGVFGDAGHRKVGHTGTFEGGSAALYSYPEVGLDIAVLANTRGDGTPHAMTIEREIARLVLGVSSVQPPAAGRPLTETERRAIEGYYSDSRTFEARIDGGELLALRDGEEQERLLHLGGMRFQRADAPDVFEWFLLDGDTAGWWVYSISGSYVEVLRRQPEGAAR